MQLTRQQIVKRHLAARALRLASNAAATSESAIFQPDDRDRVATRVTFPMLCPHCECSIYDERIVLIRYLCGRGSIFHTDAGHELHYHGRVLQRIECGQPVTARIISRSSPGPG